MVDFRYYLNRQGPRGQQGVKGEQGYSPQVTVGKNTASEFTLKVINEDGSFETENLKVVPENRGGTYVRYDKDTYQEYIGDPDIATTRTFGVVRLATKEDLGTQEESRAVTSALLDTYLQENYLNKVNGDAVTGDVYFRGRTGFTKPILVDGLKGDNEKQYLTRSDTSTAIGSLAIPDDDSRLAQGSKEIAYTSDLTEFVTNTTLNNAISNFVLEEGSITAGDNITLERTEKGIKISSTGGGAGDVTLAGDNSFTGNNTFDGVSTFNGDTWVDFLKVGTSLTNQQDKKFLAQGSVTAGSDNLLITETTDGVQIICSAPTNAQIEALQRLINDLSTKVDNLTTRLNNLEEVIDGGIA